MICEWPPTGSKRHTRHHTHDHLIQTCGKTLLLDPFNILQVHNTGR